MMWFLPLTKERELYLSESGRLALSLPAVSLPVLSLPKWSNWSKGGVWTFDGSGLRRSRAGRPCLGPELV
ncbi:MAG: hypothetical protein ACLFO5_08365, partial [Opitutales bacterium]